MMVVRHICEDLQTGQRILYDNNNNNYNCNIYGDKLTQFLPNISGTATAKERGLVLKNKNKGVGTKQYMPSVRKFEGYTHFPRPLTRPLNGIKELFGNKELIDKIKETFNNEAVLKLFDVKSNTGLPYLTSALTMDASKVDRERLLKVIDDYFEEYKIKNKYKLNLMEKDSVILALRYFKNFINTNKDSNLVNGRCLPDPSTTVKKQFKTISNQMKRLNHQNFEKTTKTHNDNINSGNAKEEEDELSFLSTELGEGSLDPETSINKVNGVENMKESLKREKIYINGYLPPQEKEEGIIRKVVKREFKSNGDFYLDDVELFKKGRKFIKCS